MTLYYLQKKIKFDKLVGLKNHRYELVMRNKMKKLRNIHPGEILQEEFLISLKISAYRLSKDIGIPQTRISEIIKGNRRITADTALRLSKYFENSVKFWLGIQDDFDIEEESNQKKKQLNAIKIYIQNAA